MPNIHFYKMEGAGNDFIIIDNFEYGFSLEEIIQMTPKLCHRKFGVGADGLMALERPNKKGVDYTMVYRNADGSDAGMCGNGSRCLAVFASNRGFGRKMRFNVHDALYEASVDGEYAEITFPDVSSPHSINVDGQDLIQVYTGTEHVVRLSKKDELQDEDGLHSLGSSIRRKDEFLPNGTNVNFVYKQGEHDIHLQTYEKGVEGLTLACGTGAIASAIAAHHLAKEKDQSDYYKIKVKGGNLGVSFEFKHKSKTYKNVILKGPASFVFEGDVQI